MRTWTYSDDTIFPRPTITGPWTDEPDKAQWVDGATDLDCLAVRNAMHAWCGYVGLPPGHPLHGAHYDNVRLRGLDVHGGLTFSNACSGSGEERGVCHVPEPGRPTDVWWLGFDCSHYGDLCPNTHEYTAESFAQLAKDRAARGFEQPEAYLPVYRDLDYVVSECALLAKQLAALSSADVRDGDGDEGGGDDD